MVGGRTSPAIAVAQLSDLALAALLDFNVAAIDEDAGRVYFHSAADRDAALAALPSQFPELAFTALDVPDEDWAVKSQANLKAVQVGNILVAPPWDVPSQRKLAPTIVVIQPSMGFGTGHHATTRLCLAALQQIDLRGKSVIDVGTGSGVLAIAASLLGAARVVAIDDDPDAMQAAAENVALNPEARVERQTIDLRAVNPGMFDVVIANLTGGLLVQAASRLLGLSAPSGQVILSGFMVHEEADVIGAFAHLRLRAQGQEDEWLCVTLQH